MGNARSLPGSATGSLQILVFVNPHLWSGSLDSDRTNEIANTSRRDEGPKKNRGRDSVGPNSQHEDSRGPQPAAPHHRNLFKLLNFAFALPGTNATCERLFSQVKCFWHQWKGNMVYDTMVEVMKIRFNLTNKPEEIFDLFVSDAQLREEIYANAKHGNGSRKPRTHLPVKRPRTRMTMRMKEEEEEEDSH